MNKQYSLKIEDIISLLNAQWDSLVIELVPNVKQYQGYFTVGDLDGNSGSSLVLYRGAKAGSWRDYSTEDSGDALILIEKQVTGGDRGKAIGWAKQWLGIDDENEITFEARKKAARKQKQKNDHLIKQQLEQRLKQAKAIFLSASDKMHGTMGEEYFISRGIDLGDLLGKIRAVRFERECYEAETRSHHPALVSSISVPNGDKLEMSIHRTYLQYEINADGECLSVIKLAVKNPKKVLGDYRGGYIPLWRGKSNKIIFKADPSEWVVITEGIEDGLSVVISDPDFRVLCAVSLANMAAIILPCNVKNVILVKDNDWNNIKAEQAFERAIDWHHQNGRRVKILKTPASVGHDLNEWLCGNFQKND